MNQLFAQRRQVSVRDAALVAGAVVLVAYLVFRVTQASGATMSLVPDAASIMPGSNLSILINLDSAGLAEGESINAVQANLSFPADHLEFVSVDTTGSAFEIPVQTANSEGGVRIARGTLYPVTGNVQVAKVNFKVKDLLGSLPIGFGTGSLVVRASDNHNVLTTLSGTTIEVSTTPGIGPPAPPPVLEPPPGPPPLPVYDFTPDGSDYSYNFPDSYSYSGFSNVPLEPSGSSLTPLEPIAPQATDTTTDQTTKQNLGPVQTIIAIFKAWYDSIVQSIAAKYGGGTPTGQ